MKIILYILIFFAGFTVGWFLFHTPAPDPTAYSIVHDTLTITRYNYETARDTVIRWYEKVIYKSPEPVVIYSQKTDSVFIEKIRYKDLMLKLNKKGNDLKIFAVNSYDSTVKEYFFPNIYPNFSATSTEGNIIIKNNRFDLDFFRFSLEHQRTIPQYDKLANGNLTLGFEPKLKFGNSFELELGLKHKTENTLSLNNTITSAKLSFSFK